MRPLVDAPRVAAHLEDPDVVVVDVRWYLDSWSGWSARADRSVETGGR